MIKKFAFTLSEVLITLVIVGIVSVLTVPSLINKLNNQETVSRLKKAYSTLSQATNKIISEEGPANIWTTSHNKIYLLYKSKLINSKECSNMEGCFDQKYRFLNSNTAQSGWNDASRNKLILQDGTQIIFLGTTDSTCSLDNNYDDGSKDFCARIIVDINGEKKPNIIGKDIFEFVIKKNGLYPAGCDYSDYCNKTKNGRACACRVLRENAINY